MEESSRSLGFAHDFVLLLSFYPFSFAHKTLLAFSTFSLQSFTCKIYTSSHGMASDDEKRREYDIHRKHHHVRLKTFTPFMCHAEYLLKFHENLLSQLLSREMKTFYTTSHNFLQINNCTINLLIFIFKKICCV